MRCVTLATCSLLCSAYVADASATSAYDNQPGRASSTIMTVTLAPTDFASANPCATPCSATSDPSVGMRICRYMLHLPMAWTYRCLPDAGSSGVSDTVLRQINSVWGIAP